jgi:DNA-binding NarL/FixJ family response regulator
MSAKSILLIEDCLLLKEELTTMFRSDDEFQVIAEFEDDDTARQLKSLNLQPDVVLLELGLEYTNNLTLVALLRQEIPAARIVAMDVRPLRLNIIDFVRSGGHALILKKSPAVDLQSRLLNAAQGGGVHSPQLTRSMFNQAMSNALIKRRSSLQ